MTIVVYASFEQQDEADHGAAALVDAGFGRSSIATFYLSPPGREEDDSAPHTGTSDESPGSQEAGEDSASGTGVGTLFGAAAGVAATPLLGPLAIAGGAGIGAYVGSLYGALGGMQEDASEGAQGAGHTHRPHPGHEADARLHSGMRVAVAVADAAQGERARSILQAHRGLDIVTGEGVVEDGTLVSPQRPPDSPRI